MPNKKMNQKPGGSSSGNQKRQTNKGSNSHGMTPGAMPHIPTARERAKEMDQNRRWNAQTFEL